MSVTGKVLFSPGRLLATPGVLSEIEASGDSLLDLLARHLTGDWGVLDSGDQRANDNAVLFGDRILSAYLLTNGTKIWVITEWDRSATTCLLPEEY
jgi:hypothetical protein